MISQDDFQEVPIYTEDHPFSVGPINYKFEPGLAYFVRGDNGSGKTTVMRLLTGLIAPDSGKILVDGRIVSPSDSQAYRNLFSCIFSDFHLFGRLYGLSSVDDARVEFWLDKLGIADKVSVVDGKFDNLNLSTGQRKRIALMVAVLEERPIVVLDEWASDQDPSFRKFFYETIIPELKALNKIVIAITHDENYFSYADHLLRIESGQLTEDFHP
jgi:putative ATP-binding cassette transporter